MPIVCLIIFALGGCVAVPVEHELITYVDSTFSRTRGVACSEQTNDDPIEPGKRTALAGEGFSLLSWNIHKAGHEAWPQDFARLSEGQDLVLVQEAHLTPSFRDLFSRGRYTWSMARAYDLQGAETGVLTASKVAPVNGCVLRTTEPLIRVPKSVLITRYAIADANDDLMVANLHGVNFSLGTESFEGQLEATAGVLSQHEGPVILGGDFNTWSEQRREILDQITQRLGLRDIGFQYDRRSRLLGHTLDHVFYRGLEVVAAESMVVSSSDHNPLRVVFRFLK